VLAFVDESGDLGFKFESGSSRYFTIAIVLFEQADWALGCQRAIERLRVSLNLAPSYEFHFHSDSHTRRMAPLTAIRDQRFACYTFTLDKRSPRLTGQGFQYRSSGYKWVCKTAFENASSDLRRATVVIDGSGERRFRREVSAYLRARINTPGERQIASVKMGRSHLDPLLQLADYVAGVTNRVQEGKIGADVYESLLRSKRRSQRKWP